MVYILKEILNNEGFRTIGLRRQLRLFFNELNGISISVIYEIVITNNIDDKINNGNICFLEDLNLNYEKCKIKETALIKKMGCKSGFYLTEYKPAFFVAIQAIEVASQIAVIQNQKENFSHNKISSFRVYISIGDIIGINNGSYFQIILIAHSKINLLIDKGGINFKTICNVISIECNIVLDYENKNGINLKITLKGYYQNQLNQITLDQSYAFI